MSRPLEKKKDREKIIKWETLGLNTDQYPLPE